MKEGKRGNREKRLCSKTGKEMMEAWTRTEKRNLILGT